MARGDKRARHLEAVRLFTEREFDILDLFDKVAAAAGRFTAKLAVAESDQGRVTKGHIAYRPVPVRVGGTVASLVFTEDLVVTESVLSDSLILPQAPSVALGGSRQVRMGLEQYPGMPDEIKDAEGGSPIAYRRPRLDIVTDEAGIVTDRHMHPASISANRLPNAQFEQVAFAHLLGDAAAALGIEMSS